MTQLARVRAVLAQAATVSVVLASVSWTPIYPASNNQIDLWTLRDSGCACPFSPSQRTCACCSVDGGCPCGRAAPSRCAQCGLQQHCGNMCNITIDSHILESSSGKRHGQIKLVIPAGPTYCWYLFHGEPMARIEVQVYRMVRSGKWLNGTGCVGGGLTLRAGQKLNASTETTLRVCGENRRFSPPVTLLIDSMDAVMEYRVPKSTERSLFMAFFNFSPRHSPHVGIQSRGGRPVPHTECDWLYQDVDCTRKGSCVLASPGYPGIYPPNTRCKYFIFINKISTSVTIRFSVMDLPKQFCDSHYLTVYAGSTVASPWLATVCGDNTTTVQYRGPKLLVEFSSGVSAPPFSFSGFLASLEIREVSDRHLSVGQPAPGVPQGAPLGSPKDGTSPEEKPSLLLNEVAAGGALLISGHRQRAGFFSTDTTCNFTFQGRPNDLVVISLLNYRLGGEPCSGVLEVHSDGALADVASFRRCSPVYRTVRDHLGRASVAQKLWSSSNKVFISFRPRPEAGQHDFMEGAYMFHNADSEGHLTSQQLCHAVTNAEVSAHSGQVNMPEGIPLLWDFEGPLSCRHTFHVKGRSLQIQVTSTDRPQPGHGSHHCLTRCVGHRCRCLVDLVALQDVDHLQLLTLDGRPIACLCGNFTGALPLTLHTNRDVIASYNMAHFMWAAIGPNFSLQYRFEESSCPPPSPGALRGSLSPSWPDLASVQTSTHVFNFVRCSWTFLDRPGMSQTLTLEASSDAGGGARCRQLNASVTSLARGPHGLDELLDVFCAGQRRRTVPLRLGFNHTVSLTNLGPAPATFRLEWELRNRSLPSAALSSVCRLGGWLWWAPLLLSVGVT